MKDLTKEWLEALRSGKYTQARYALHNDTGYCCLGVACEVAGLRGERFNGKWCYSGASIMLPGKLQVVDPTRAPGDHHEVERELARMNDAGRSFTEIADVVAKYGYQLLLLDRPDE